MVALSLVRLDTMMMGAGLVWNVATELAVKTQLTKVTFRLRFLFGVGLAKEKIFRRNGIKWQQKRVKIKKG